MKAMLALVVPAVLSAGPALAGVDVLESALANAARQEMSVVPWVGIKVSQVTVTDKISWVAHTSGRQVYACAAHADADALLSAEGVACVRAGSAPRTPEARVRDAKAEMAQVRRMSVSVPVWTGPDARGAVYSYDTVTLSPR